ncbi:hypothetical protein RJ641_035027 [Dillenia turbinata]|uniref:Uncharacterized protein n=1 Tax=Dillenia turbinata TaxID=194707 RepID=A0AAN8VWK9_9MAGN
MAAVVAEQSQPPKPLKDQPQEAVAEQYFHKLLSSYLGFGFAIFLGFLPKSSISLVSVLRSRNRELALKIVELEGQIRQMQSRRKEDSKANARVVEIFASHRHAWQQEEKRLLQQIDESAEEMAHLRSKIEDLEKREGELERELSERDEMINFMSRKTTEELDEKDFVDDGEICTEEFGSSRFGKTRVSEKWSKNVDDVGVVYGLGNGFAPNGPEFFTDPINGLSQDFFSSKIWAERANNLWQDLKYESLESTYNLKHFVSRRESPWKVDVESTGVAPKLKLLEQELLNLERVGKSDLSKVPLTLRKQAKRYQALAGKIDDLCRRMQASDPCESALNPEFRTQRQTEFLLEAFQLQQRASETGQKLMALQAETGKSYMWDELGNQAKLTTRRALESIRNNFKEIQRNLEIWLARIIGDLEGILARDGASRVREYYLSRYPFVQ